MRQYKLVLYPALPEFSTFDLEKLVMALKNCGLIAGETQHDAYLAGDGFINQLSFLGCAPNIILSPAEGDNYCHVIINAAESESRCLGHTTTVIPRCPHCKQKMTHWQHIKNWQLGTTLCTCSHCSQTTAMQNLKWKQEGAYGCMAVNIINIHPFEAVPSESLLHTLQAATDVEWDYCYAEHKMHD